jgi:hypothetical protein
MRERVGWIVCCLACLAGARAQGAEATFVVPVMKAPPKIDGRIEAAEWAVSAGFDGFGRDGGKLARRRVQAFVGATRTHLFVAIRSWLPDEGKLLAKVERDSAKAVYDDAVEVFVNPTPDDAKQVDYQVLRNSLGRGSDHVHTLGGAKESPAWRGGWRQAHGFHDGWWHFECGIPVESMGRAARGRKTTDGAWKINLTRDWKFPWEWSSLSAAAGGYAFTGLRFRFAEDAPAVQYRADGDAFLANFPARLTLHNPTSKPMALRAELALGRNRMPALGAGGPVRLAAGASRTVTLAVPKDEATTRFELRVLVASADGKTTYYDRSVSWPKGKPYRYVAGEAKAAEPIAFRFAYYPYRSRMRVLADVNGLPKDAKLTKLTAEVRGRLDRKVVHRAAFEPAGFRDGRQEIAFDLPPLEGLYEIALLAEGRGVPREAIAQPFERKVFPWERVPAGLSTKVYPPFEPIKVAGKTLTTVLRKHELNDAGLWDQVAAASAHTGISRAILARPMRYVVRAGGEPLAVRAEPLKFTQTAPHRVVTVSRLAAGPLRAASKNTWDYDGTMRVDLTLEPTGGRELRELTLEVPLAAAAAPLIHANADRIRAPVAQRVPAGEGAVWDGSKVACDEMPRNFCPYVYLGNAVRGLCWFADNDRGWSWDRSTPNVTVVRRGGVLSLRVHLINKPIRIESPRTITFGLLAAPVKPRLSPGGRHEWRYRYLRDGYTLLGTDVNWLARGNCGSVYPAGKDLYLWEMIAKGNRERLDNEQVERVVAHGRRYFEPYGKQRVGSFEAHARHNLRSRYGKKMVFYYNRASYQLAEEFETFKDEWCLTDLRSIPKGRGLGEIKIVPSASYIDHALYWYARSFEIGANRGVYWDNFFLAPSCNTEMTDAYRLPGGQIVPAGGLWALRELCRRTFVMMNERGLPPITFPHMTSFNPLPMMAFATVQYDWEWKYSRGDVQDRHTRELILLMSTGDLAGVWPVPLSDHGPQERDPWVQRTFTAVRLVHELDGCGGFGLDWVDVHRANRKLAEPVVAMLAEPKLEVWRYWDERPQPVAATNPDVPTIVYAVPGRKAVVVATSYAAKDETVTLKVDLEALGLTGRCRIVDAETQQRLPLADGRVRFGLKKHDVKVLLLSPEKGQ